MAIAFGAIGTKQTAGTTTVAIAYPATPGAGDMAVAARAIWNTLAASGADEAGWTNNGELFGGNAGGGADNHRLYARADTLQLTGAESGSVTFDQNSTPDGVCGVMARYTKGAGETWSAVTSTTGDDATQAADRSITGSGNLTLAAGDTVVVVVATNTDTSLTITSPAITASGITFGATTRRTSGVGSTTGQDGNVEIFDATVSSGSGTTAPSIAFTTATSQSGPAVFLRLRAINADATVTGVTATATGASVAPVATATSTVTGVKATTSALASAPAVAGHFTAVGVAATATGQAIAPTLSASSTVTAVAATGTGAAVAPVLTAASNVTAVAATATGTAIAPTVSTAGNATVTAVAATATGVGVVPTVTASSSVTGVAATASGVGRAPTVAASSTVAAVAATASCAAIAPAVTASSTVAAVKATASSASVAPAVSASSTVAATVMTSTALANPATLSATANIQATAALATALALPPTVTGGTPGPVADHPAESTALVVDPVRSTATVGTQRASTGGITPLAASAMNAYAHTSSTPEVGPSN